MLSSASRHIFSSSRKAISIIQVVFDLTNCTFSVSIEELTVHIFWWLDSKFKANLSRVTNFYLRFFFTKNKSKKYISEIKTILFVTQIIKVNKTTLSSTQFFKNFLQIRVNQFDRIELSSSFVMSNNDNKEINLCVKNETIVQWVSDCAVRTSN